MKQAVLLLGAAALMAGLAGCASTPPTAVPSGMSPGVFGRLECEGGKAFAARFAEGGQSVRVRALHGSAELLRQSDTEFGGDDYRLVTTGPDGVALFHKGKAEARLCKSVTP